MTLDAVAQLQRFIDTHSEEEASKMLKRAMEIYSREEHKAFYKDQHEKGARCEVCNRELIVPEYILKGICPRCLNNARNK